MKAGLLGRTLGHSLSPQIHRFFGDYEYRLYEKEPQAVEGFLRDGFTEGGLKFLNVTIPYKQTVARLCDELSPVAQALGNVNFVTRAASGKLVGDNTDAFGFARLLEANGIEVRGINAAVLGAGGAAVTVKTVLEDRGAARVRLVRRGEVPAGDDELIVNATPVGMWPHVDEVRVEIADYPQCRAVLDLVYNPSPTRLIREARACGKIAADGMVMLIAQAYRAWKLAGGGDERILFLYGPPASGKSTWAKMLAQATGMKLVDLDAEIVKAERRSIAEIFTAVGESGFRAIEKRELKRMIAAGGKQVVALGGGALLDAESRAIVEAVGRVAVLNCREEELVRRAALSKARPLIDGDQAGLLKKLLASRREHYRSFVHQVELTI